MKIYLTVNDPTALSGYLNLDALIIEGKTQADVSNLSDYADSGEVMELVVPDALDYFHLGDKEKVLAGWVSLLGHGGEIVIGGLDLDEVALSIYNGLDTRSANSLLYSTQPNLPRRQSLLNIGDVVEILTMMGLHILSKRVQNNQYYVRAVRL